MLKLGIEPRTQNIVDQTFATQHALARFNTTLVKEEKMQEEEGEDLCF